MVRRKSANFRFIAMIPSVLLQGTDAEQVAIDLIRKLELRNIQLDAVLQLTQAINYNFSQAALIDIYRYLLTEELKIKRILLYLQEPEWRRYASRQLELGQYPVHPDKLFPYRAMGPLSNELKQLFPEFEWVVPVIFKQDPIAFVLLGPIEQDDPDVRKEIMSYVQGVTNIVAVANENRKLQEHQLHQEKIRNELALAAQMQGMLIPNNSELPASGGVELKAIYLPHRDVGGDYYDVVPVNENELVFCVADVSGKGVPAALLMSNFQANLRALLRFHPTLPELVQELNKAVLSITQGEKFITLFIAKLDRQTGLLKYISAGHVPPLLYSQGQITELKTGTTILGMFPELPFLNFGKAQLQPGDTLVAFTDGASELTNYRGQALGSEGLARIIENNAGLSVEALNDTIMAELLAFKGQQEFDDDVTVLSLRFG